MIDVVLLYGIISKGFRLKCNSNRRVGERVMLHVSYKQGSKRKNRRNFNRIFHYLLREYPEKINSTAFFKLLKTLFFVTESVLTYAGQCDGFSYSRGTQVRILSTDTFSLLKILEEHRTVYNVYTNKK